MNLSHFNYFCAASLFGNISLIAADNPLSRALRDSLYIFGITGLIIVRSAYASTELDSNSRQSIRLSCPSQSFPEFLSAYANSEALQRTFLKTPLRMQKLDLDAEPEPKPISWKLKYSKLKFPLLPLRIDRDVRALSLRIDKWSEKIAEATLFRQDVGHQVTYIFFKNDCWILMAIEDWSM